MGRVRRLWLIAVCGFALVAGSATVPAQAPGCDEKMSHQFDFWIGEWEVFVNGKKAGTNSIQPILDGCVLQENWVGAQGGSGSSFNFYNPSTKKWQQFWVWKSGTTLDLKGGLEDGKMILKGEGKDRNGKPVLNRITWTPGKDGSVRQFWETSSDGGKTWKAAFDGHYKKKG